MSRHEISLPASIVPSETPGAAPCVVIVGRPNVGKSSLLNCLARHRIAIVDPAAGVTRDRISAFVEHQDKLFELWDTGGIGTPDDLAAEVEGQIEAALRRADVVLFVVDAQAGLLPLDGEIGRHLHRIGRKVMLVLNKVDHPKHEEAGAEFEAFGFGTPQPISALSGYGRTDLLDALVELLPAAHQRPAEPVMRLAVVGRQNVGKSTLINTLAREERMIVSELPGTTRDAVDVRFEWKGRAFIAVDTAGLKRKTRVADSVEFYSLARAFRAIRRADVVLHLFDVGAEMTHVDKHLAAFVEEEAKPCVLVVNKWDIAKKKITSEQYLKYLNQELKGLSFAPVTFASAKENFNIERTLEVAESVFQQSRMELATGPLNAALAKATQARPPEISHGKRPRLFYATQIGVAPPTFLVFCSNPQFLTRSYTRYLGNAFRKILPMSEVPMRFVFRARPRREFTPHPPAPRGRKKR